MLAVRLACLCLRARARARDLGALSADSRASVRALIDARLPVRLRRFVRNSSAARLVCVYLRGGLSACVRAGARALLTSSSVTLRRLGAAGPTHPLSGAARLYCCCRCCCCWLGCSVCARSRATSRAHKHAAVLFWPTRTHTHARTNPLKPITQRLAYSRAPKARARRFRPADQIDRKSRTRLYRRELIIRANVSAA